MKLLSNKSPFLVILLIFLFALFLRLYRLGQVPSGFHLDEVANTYIGRFILENGVDIYGNLWPIFSVDKQGDFPPVLPMYLNGLGALIFGHDIFGGRFVIALLGALLVVPVFGLGLILFGYLRWAYVASLIVAVAPWHLSLSRVGGEGIVALTVFACALWLLLRGWQLNQQKLILFSLPLLWLNYLFYPTYRVLVPVTLFCLIFLITVRLRKLILVGLGFSIFFTVLIMLTPWGSQRYRDISLTSHVAQDANWQGYRYNEKSPLEAKIFQNKLVHLGRGFLEQYARYFAPEFWFIRAVSPPWYALPQSGLLLTSWILFVIALVLWGKSDTPTFANKQFKMWLFVLGLFFLGPAASSLTVDYTPHIHRNLFAFLPTALLLTWGVKLLYQHVPQVIFKILLVLVLIDFMFNYHNYLTHTNLITALHRGDPNREMVNYLRYEVANYDKVYVFSSGFLPTYYLYFTGEFGRDLVGKFDKMRLQTYRNIQFINNDCPQPRHRQLMESAKKALILYSSTCSGKDLSQNCKKFKEIKGVGFQIPVYFVAVCN